MKVAQVVPAISRESSGPSYSVMRLSDAVAAAGAESTLVSMDWDGHADPKPGTRAFPMGLGPKKLGRCPQMRRWLNAQASGGDIDVIHNHSLWQMNSIYPAVAARRGKIAFVSSPRGGLSTWAMKHGSLLKRVFWPLLQRRALESSACFHATSHDEADDIRRLGFEQPVAVIPNGIDVPDYQQAASCRDRTLLFLGRIHKVKGLDLLLPAWKSVQNKHRDWRLVIAGGDHGYRGVSGYLNELRSHAEALGLERIDFVGEQTGDKKLRLMQSAELFVLPSHSENFGIAVAEALAAGTPAVVTKGAPWDGLNVNDAGWHIETNVDSLSQCLHHALSRTSDELSEMGWRGREWMLREFSWKSVAHQMLSVYQWLIECGERPSCVR